MQLSETSTKWSDICREIIDGNVIGEDGPVEEKIPSISSNETGVEVVEYENGIEVSNCESKPYENDDFSFIFL